MDNYCIHKYRLISFFENFITRCSIFIVNSKDEEISLITEKNYARITINFHIIRLTYKAIVSIINLLHQTA
jgi:hypothetical protein